MQLAFHRTYSGNHLWILETIATISLKPSHSAQRIDRFNEFNDRPLNVFVLVSFYFFFSFFFLVAF